MFYLNTTDDVTLSQKQMDTFQEKYASLFSRKTFRCFYLSKWGINFQPSFLLEAARSLQTEPIDFILCGGGDYEARIRQQSSSLSNVLPGFLSHEEAFFLAKHCDCAILFISPKIIQQFTNLTPTIPNKFFLYMMCDLPILNNMLGEISEIIAK